MIKLKGKNKTSKKIILLIILLLFIPVLFVIPFLGILGYTFLYSAKNSAKSSEIYTCAIAEAKKNKTVIEKIGEPVEPGAFVYTKRWAYGEFHETASFSTSLTGPKGSGNLYVQAHLDITYSSLRLIFKDEKKPEVIYEGTFPCERE